MVDENRKGVFVEINVPEARDSQPALKGTQKQEWERAPKKKILFVLGVILMVWLLFRHSGCEDLITYVPEHPSNSFGTGGGTIGAAYRLKAEGKEWGTYATHGEAMRACLF